MKYSSINPIYPGGMQNFDVITKHWIPKQIFSLKIYGCKSYKNLDQKDTKNDFQDHIHYYTIKCKDYYFWCVAKSDIEFMMTCNGSNK